MSHNITLRGVQISDLLLLAEIANDLSDGKVKLVMDAKSFRTYRGQDTSCDAKLEMPGIHDIGLVKQPGDFYTLKFDPYGMDRVFQSGFNTIGKLVQEYVLRQAEYRAAMDGYSCSRFMQKDGTVSLEMVRAA
jgi:hypothetical protein